MRKVDAYVWMELLNMSQAQAPTLCRKNCISRIL